MTLAKKVPEGGNAQRQAGQTKAEKIALIAANVRQRAGKILASVGLSGEGLMNEDELLKLAEKDLEKKLSDGSNG